MRQVLFRGHVVWVDDDGQFLGIAGGGMPGAEPGISNDRERDIMSRLPDADIVGLVGPGVVPGGEPQRGGRIVPETGKTPGIFRPLTGAQQNNRGGSRIVTLGGPGGIGSPVQNLSSIVETSKDVGDDAESINVCLGLDFIDQGFDPANPTDQDLIPFEITALVQWGVGGASFTAEVDWNQGTVFALPASFVRISARVGAIAPGPMPIELTLSAALSYGITNARFASPVRKSVIASVGAMLPLTTTTVFRIPRWANSFTLMGTPVGGLVPGPAPALRANLKDTATGADLAVFDMVTRSNLGIQHECQFPITPACRFMTITNMDPLNSISQVRVMFNLGF